MPWSFLSLIAGLAIGIAVVHFWPKQGFGSSKRDQEFLQKAREEAERIQSESKENLEHLKRVFSEEEKSLEESIESMEKNVIHKEELAKRWEERNQNQKQSLEELQKEVALMNANQNELSQSMTEVLAKAAKLSPEQAMESVQSDLEQLVSRDKDRRVNTEIEELHEDIMRHAKAVLQIVIQRLGVPSSVDRNNTNVQIREEAFKGMLIGKNGTNIAYLESLLPVSIIFNMGDPGNVHVGGVNLLRRNIAKRAIEKMQQLAKKGSKIDHELIKKTVEECEESLMRECDEKGRWALKQMGLDPKDTPDELVNYIGRLYFRTSYGQNIIHHSLEMAYAARLIAELIGTDANVAMQAAFYHDIGKAIDHDIGGSHDDISKEILDRHGWDPAIVYAAYCHHDKVPCLAPADFICKAVDAISGGRPGARMESVTNYFEKILQLEGCAKAYEGVQKVACMSAGREVRVNVDKDRIKDTDMQALGDQIAAKISEEVAFPGIIKVNLIRQTRSTDFAREKATHR
jgi:ribonuclease Y